MSDPGSVLVSFRGVDKSYDGEQYVVQGLDLDLYKGEFLTLLGPSGSGKTTCLMMLAGFEHPTHGEILLGGKVINRIPPHKRQIGMVFQNYALFPQMSVAENVAYPLVVRRMDRAHINTAVNRALDMVQMRSYADRSPAMLSGGQQQRIALARALVFDPPLVLMDEPLGALDKRLREQMQLEIKQLHQSLGLTVVYVTHDQSEALTMSDRVAVFDAGRIQQIGPVRALYESPENRTVANFIGDSNTFDGVISEINETACVLTLTNGEQVAGVCHVGTEVGKTAQACIRPERMCVLGAGVPSGAAGSTLSKNVLSAVATALIYHGDHYRLICTPTGMQASCVVKVALDDPYIGSFQTGKAIRVGFSASFLRVFP